MEKWNPICMGYGRDALYTCALCEEFHLKPTPDRTRGCYRCPLDRSGNNCERSFSSWKDYRAAYWAIFGDDDDERINRKLNSSEEAEAILEALVMLLPIKERESYGG